MLSKFKHIFKTFLAFGSFLKQKMHKLTFFIFIFALFSCKSQDCDYDSKKNKSNEQVVIEKKEEPVELSFIKDIPVPTNFVRVEVDSNSYGNYLRNLPLNDDNTVYYYNGTRKHTQDLHYAVIDIDVGERDLQQCADAAMRLRAEYLYSQERYNEIHFNFLSDGKPRYYTDYSGTDYSYSKFRKYMDYIFAYANSASLNKEMQSIELEEMQIGDMFLRKGEVYGHVVIVVDMAENQKNGKKVFLLAQSYMPAQSIHILKNFNSSKLSPWYDLDFGKNLHTPEWDFTNEDLKSW